MIDQQDPLVGCRVKWDAFTSANGTTIPAGEGTYEGACLCRLDDGTPVPVSPYHLTVLDMAQYRANLERGQEPDAWQVEEAKLAYGGPPDWVPSPEGYAVGAWEPIGTRAEGYQSVILWRRPLRRV